MKQSIYIKYILLHIFMGFCVFTFKFSASIFFLIINFYFFYRIFKEPKNTTFLVLLASAYVVGSEVFFRMNGGTFLYEASKYLVILYMLIGIFRNKFHNDAILYFIYITLLIPGIFIAATTLGFDTNIRKAIAFNLSGPVCLGIGAIFCFKRKITIKHLQLIILAFLLPLISTTTFLFFYTPDIQSVITGTSSNFQASGGFGPNQMATVLGLGMFILTVRFFISKKDTWVRFLDLGILGLMSFRALVTLSRGGIFTALIMILCFVFFYYRFLPSRKRIHIRKSIVIFILLGCLTWVVSSALTTGFLDKRYANKNAAGVEKKDISTGRADLISYELEAFIENPLTGIGVGKVKESREQDTGVYAASHNEVTRILAEHGVLGIFAFLILLLTPLVYRIRNKKNIFFYSFYLFWLLTINHSAMRIAAPAFVYGLCLLNISYEKPTIHRKPIIAKR